MSLRSLLKLLLLSVCTQLAISAELPTLYDYYTKDGIKSGLVANGSKFHLNGKEFTILSGSLHYFRVHPDLWSDRLLKMKASGLNAVQFYTAWNLHEEYPGVFDFGQTDPMLNLDRFLKLIKEHDMFAVFRPGPYICAEWEFGGLPSWLLKDPNMKVRTNYKGYLDAIDKYYAKLMAVAKPHQFTNGGPIIMTAVENEFASYGNTKGSKEDNEYLEFLRTTMVKNGIKELFFTCDNKANSNGNIPEALNTINFGSDPKGHLEALHKIQPDKPLYVAEFWTGWFDGWGGKHQTRSAKSTVDMYEQIIFQLNSSVNNYMFHGGTNFGFMGAHSITTSYDYDCNLSEDGDYNEKYNLQRNLILRFIKEGRHPNLRLPDVPKVYPKANYGTVKISGVIHFNDLLKQIKAIAATHPMRMEDINLGPNHGQNFGFINYRTTISKVQHLTIHGGFSDRAIVLIDGSIAAFAQDIHKDWDVDLTKFQYSNQNEHVLDILVENMGRGNYGGALRTDVRKGINGDVSAGNVTYKDWQIYPLELRKNFIQSLKNVKWSAYDNHNSTALYSAALDIRDDPQDTFIRLDQWVKGNVFVNGFNIGRYWNVGPQKTLYIPAPLLKKGHNDIYIFELHASSPTIEFVGKPILG